MKRTQGRQAENDLADVLASLPLGLTIERGADDDLVIVTADGRRLRLRVKALVSPAPADVGRLRPPGSGVVGVLVADRIVPRVREALRAAGWGWFDRRGHLALVGDGLLIDTEVVPMVAADDRSRPTLDTEVGLDVAVALLAQPSVRLSVRALVAYTGRSLGAVHQATRGLRDEGLLDNDGRPLTPELFWEVSARWRPKRIPLAAAPKPTGDRRARQLALGVDAERGWALCDTLAANAYGAAAVVRGDHPPDFYVADERTIRVARQLLGDPTTSDRRAATVALAPASWVCVHRVAPGSRARVAWPRAQPVVVALDLSIDAGRGREILDDWSPPEPFARVW